MKKYFKNSLKVKDIKKFLKDFDDDDNVLLECCVGEDYGDDLRDIKNGNPFQIELSNYDLGDDNFVELMFCKKKYK